MKKQVWVIGLVFLIMALGVTVASGEKIICYVSTPEKMNEVQDEINANGGEYIINLDDNITSYLSINNSNAKVTLVGNGHTLSTKTQAAITVSNGVLNLGDGKSELIIAYKGTEPDNDNPGLVFVNGKSGTCNMKDKVIITDSKKSNYLGAGVTVQGGTFYMEGGTIRDCSMVGGSVCYGGGVAVYAGGKFIMDGGVIENCSAYSSYIPTSHLIKGAGGGVFVSSGGNFTMNGGIIQNCKADYGAGVALVLSYSEYEKYLKSVPQYVWGRLDSVVTINGGEIIGNKASSIGGGIFASGLLYADAVPIATDGPGIGINYPAGLYVQRGKIADNSAYDGGGICLYGLKNVEGKQQTQIHNATISGNKAAEGAGLMIASFWTALELRDCTITGNIATKDDDGDGGLGGGIMVYNNTSTSGTKMLGTNILCNNKADTMGADVYVYNSTKQNLIFNLTSASNMKRTYDSTGVFIDGWYDDTSPRWSIDKVCRSNTYLGDKFKGNYEEGKFQGFIAAFTLNEIQITKIWNDNQAKEKRPESVTFTLTDAENNPIKLPKYDEVTKNWIESDEPAQITLTAENVDSTDPSKSKWEGTIVPLLKDNYADPSKYRLYESGTGNFYQLKRGDPEIKSSSTSRPGVFLASFTNIGCIPVSININWKDSDTKSRPQALKVRLMIESAPQQVIEDIDGNKEFELSARNNWSTNIYLPLGNYDNLKAVAEDVTVYGYEQTYESSKSRDGKYTFKFVNTRREFTVTFDLGDGTVISQQIVAEGKVASKPEDPVRAGYRFVQWMNGQEPYDFSTPVTGDLTLTAQWKEAGEYFVAEGQDSIWQKEDSQLLLFHIRNTVNDEKTYGKFTYIEVDGQKVEADTREAQMGGIIIELKPGFLETLSLGRHILRVYFSDGAVDVIFHVVQTEAINETLPDTGDNSNLLYWIGLAFIGAVGILVLLKRRKRNS